MKHTTTNFLTLWNNIEALLDSRCPTWRTYLEEMGQLEAIKCRSEGRTWSDDEVFEALLMAVLSSITDWSKIMRIKESLEEPFSGFSLEAYASVSKSEISNRLVPWFKERKAGSRSLRRNLVNLIGTARKLLEYSNCHGTADDYFTSLLCRCGQDPKKAALRLGCPGEYKLPSLGVPLAAQALKNLGFDVAKPDRHIMRAVGAFGLVDFSPWKYAQTEKGARNAPDPTTKRHQLAMCALEEMADAAKQHPVLVDSAIWLLCARGGKESGLYLTNAQLAEMASRQEPSEAR